MKSSILRSLLKNYGQTLLVGLSIFILTIALTAKAGVLDDVITKGPGAVFAADISDAQGETVVEEVNPAPEAAPESAPVEAPAEAPAPAPVEAPAEAPAEVPAPAPAEAPASVPDVVPMDPGVAPAPASTEIDQGSSTPAAPPPVTVPDQNAEAPVPVYTTDNQGPDSGVAGIVDQGSGSGGAGAPAEQARVCGDPFAKDLGAGLAQNYRVCNGVEEKVGSPYQIGEPASASDPNANHGKLLSSGGECVDGRMRWVNRWEDGWIDVDERGSGNEQCTGAGPGGGSQYAAGVGVGGASSGQGSGASGASGQGAPSGSGQVAAAQSTGTGGPGPVVAAPADANSPWECQRAYARGENACNDNITYCENSTDGSRNSFMIFKHQGVCDPTHGERDGRGCVFQYDIVGGTHQPVLCAERGAPPPPPGAPPIVPAGAPEMVTTCKNQTITKAQLDAELRAAGYGGPWDTGSALAGYNRAACPPAAPPPGQPPRAPVVCPADVQRCPDGSSVARNPNNNCQFYACPVTPVVPAPGAPIIVNPPAIARSISNTVSANSTASVSNSGNATASNDISGIVGSGNGMGVGGPSQGGTGGAGSVTLPGSTITTVPLAVTGTKEIVTQVFRRAEVAGCPADTKKVGEEKLADGTIRIKCEPIEVCKPGESMEIRGNTIICFAAQPKTFVLGATALPAVVDGKQPVVTGQVAVAADALPATGLPLAAWVLVGSLPFGVHLRKFASNKMQLTANSVWEDRQLRK